MATATSTAPSREDFAAMLDESFGRRHSAGRVRRQGNRRRNREGPGRHRRRREDRGARRAPRIRGPGPPERNQDRRHRRSLPGARRERARRSGAVARQGAPRGKLGQARAGLQGQREGPGRHLQPGQGRLHRRSRRRGGVPAALAGRHPADPRRRPADELNRSRSRSSRWIAAAATSSCPAAPCWKRPAPSSARSWCRTSKRARSSTAWSRTSPTTARSSTSAASTACCTSPTSRGGASITRPKCSTSASR